MNVTGQKAIEMIVSVEPTALHACDDFISSEAPVPFVAAVAYAHRWMEFMQSSD